MSETANFWAATYEELYETTIRVWRECQNPVIALPFEIMWARMNFVPWYYGA